MEIGKYKYEGFEYTVHFTSKGDWGINKNKFYAESKSGMFKTGYHKEFNSAVGEFYTIIDCFLATTPKDIDELVSKLSELLVWTDYEDCHFDEEAAKILIQAFISRKP